MKVLGLLLLVAVPGWAEVIEKSDQQISHYAVVLPTSANTAGAFGAFFRTRLTIANFTGRSFPLTVSLGSTNGLVGERTLDLAAGWITWDDFLGTVFGFTGAGGLLFYSGNTANKFIVEAEVYTDSASGRYSTTVPSFEVVQSVEQIPNLGALVAGVNVNGNSRLNLGCFNNSTASQTVSAYVHDSSGTLLETKRFVLPPSGWLQQSVGSSVNNGLVIWPPPVEAACYAVSVDNRSNDGTLRLASFVVP